MKKPVEQVADEHDIAALKALAAGNANEGQQKRALRFILHLSGVREMPIVTDSERQDAFREGRRSVGWQIARLVELVGVTVEKKED